MHKKRGFTLLETMLALAILAILMTAVTETNMAAMVHGARVYNMTTASQLISGVVLDIEEEYRTDGFPDNSREDQTCDLPSGFDRFECRYDILGLEIAEGGAGDMGAEANDSVSGSPLMSALCSGGPSGTGPVGDPAGALASADVDTTSVGALMSLLDPNFMMLCGVNLARMCQNIRMISSFIPTIIEQAAKSTRKLRVRLSWREVGRSDKVLMVETFLTSTAKGEEEAEALTR